MPTKTETIRCLLVGPLVQREDLEGIEASNFQVLGFVDGGAHWIEELVRQKEKQFSSYFVIGDFDSYKLDTYEIDKVDRSSRCFNLEPKNLIKLSTDKDMSDLAAALQNCSKEIRNQIKKYSLQETTVTTTIELVGFWCHGHLDFAHQLGNLGETLNYVDLNSINQKLTINFYESFSESPRAIVLGPGSHHLNYQGTFSIFTSRDQNISIQGDIKYPVKNRKFSPLSSLGLHNISTGRISVNCKKGVLFLPELSADTK